MKKSNHGTVSGGGKSLHNLLLESGRTEQEIAVLAELHINTVKKIFRDDHVHHNSITKLERALRQAIEAKKLSGSLPVHRLYERASPQSNSARKRNIIEQSELLAREMSELVLELGKSGDAFQLLEVEQISNCLRFAQSALDLLSAKAK
jgi:hypothetical protein